MALITCPECQGQISDKALACPKCGAPRTPVSAAPGVYSLHAEPEGGGAGKAIAWVAGVLVLGFLASSLFGNSPEAKARQQARAAIDLCWEDQARKSLPPDTARIAAGMCERMEADLKRNSIAAATPAMPNTETVQPPNLPPPPKPRKKGEPDPTAGQGVFSPFRER